MLAAKENPSTGVSDTSDVEDSRILNKSKAPSEYKKFQGRELSEKLQSQLSDSKQTSHERNRREDIFIFVTFVLIGTTGMIGWNSLLNMLTAILTVLFNNQGTFTDTMTATYFTVTCCSTILFSRLSIAKPWILSTALSSIALLCITLGLICSFVHASAASAVMHVFGGVMGLAVATTVSSGIQVASLFPKLFVGGVATGMGLAGLLTFSVWVIASHAIFDYDIRGVRLAAWVLLGFAACLSLVAFACFQWFIRIQWVKEAFQERAQRNRRKYPTPPSDQHDQTPLEVDDAKPEWTGVEIEKGPGRNWTYDRLGYFGVLKASLPNLTLRFFIFFQTLIVFPNIGPVAWGATPLVADFATGTFQLMDFVGRYIPNVIPFFLIPERMLIWGILARLVLVVTFILSMEFPQATVFGDPWFLIIQMACLAFTNGWFSTVATIHLPGRVDGADAKACASSFGMATGFVGIVAGQWASKLVKLILGA